jgi:hypothetical protein
VDSDVWNKEVIQGLADNSCKSPLVALAVCCGAFRRMRMRKRARCGDPVCSPRLSHHYCTDMNQFGEDGYGHKANKVLSTVRGKDFRHEKNKRKRSTYTGGNITLASNSFKYDD